MRWKWLRWSGYYTRGGNSKLVELKFELIWKEETFKVTSLNNMMDLFDSSKVSILLFSACTVVKRQFVNNSFENR